MSLYTKKQRTSTINKSTGPFVPKLPPEGREGPADRDEVSVFPKGFQTGGPTRKKGRIGSVEGIILRKRPVTRSKCISDCGDSCPRGTPDHSGHFRGVVPSRLWTSVPPGQPFYPRETTSGVDQGSGGPTSTFPLPTSSVSRCSLGSPGSDEAPPVQHFPITVRAPSYRPPLRDNGVSPCTEGTPPVQSVDYNYVGSGKNPFITF